MSHFRGSSTDTLETIYYTYYPGVELQQDLYSTSKFRNNSLVIQLTQIIDRNRNEISNSILH